MNLSSTPTTPKTTPVPTTSPPASKSPKSPGHSSNPPIVLRIFKGTAQLVTPVEETSPPTPPPVAVTPERKSRRRGHSTDTAGNVSPKRLRERHKGISYNESEPEPEFDYETLSAPTQVSSRRSSKAVHPPVVQQAIEPVCEPTPEPAPDPAPEPTPEPSVVPQETESAENIAKQVEDVATMEEGEKLLASTYMDFNATEKKLLDSEPKSETDLEREKLLAVLADDNDELSQPPIVEKTDNDLPKPSENIETEWFSDSECSDTVAEQLNNANECTAKNTNEAQNLKIPKKRSIFKSRQIGEDENHPGKKKRFGLYKHKWSGSDGPPGAATPTQTRPEVNTIANTANDFDFDEVEPLTRVTSYPEPDADSMDAEAITSIKCTKKAKEVCSSLF